MEFIIFLFIIFLMVVIIYYYVVNRKLVQENYYLIDRCRDAELDLEEARRILKINDRIINELEQ